MTKTHWRIAFWLMTALTVGMEVWAANDHNPVTETWTEALTHYIPAPILLAVVAWFATWLVQHFRDSTRKKAEREQAQMHVVRTPDAVGCGPTLEAAQAAAGSLRFRESTEGERFEFTPIESFATIKDIEHLARRRPEA